ncbi:adenylyl-sulfate kinase [Pseudorhodoferax sp.]|uniref:adenylyl-sulfate kinase n=1 Tax=Pseudorhodoferax sp. TaxID=1993553 RepID=UPI0039E355E8
MPRLEQPTAPAPAPEAAAVQEWMSRQVRQDPLRLVACGGVDDGKSTLIGRLLWEARQSSDDPRNALQADARRHGTQGRGIGFDLLADGPAAEREQGSTIDVAYRFFSTPRRKFIVADPPGHAQSTRNMVAGASTADVVVLLVDARRGIVTQTRRHACLVSLAGIRHVVLAVNKMDLAAYRQDAFDAIVAGFSAMAEGLGFDRVTPIPLSAPGGENVATRSAHTPWYQGPTLMGCLETIDVPQPIQHKAVFLVQRVDRSDGGPRGFGGTLASGRLALGDTLRVTASGQTAVLVRIVTAGGDLPSAGAGDAVTLVLDRTVDASCGDVIARADQPLEMTDQFEATVVWLHDEPGHMGRTYELKLANQEASASITSLKYRIDVDTLAHEPCRQLVLNDIAVANLASSKPLVFAPHAQSPTLGGFILVDRFTHATVAMGMIRHNLRRAQNVHRQALSIGREDRERLNGHPGKVVWFTGLSGSGKSTIANALEQALHARGKRTYLLDGDNVRQGLNRDLGFTDADRVENIRRVAEVARLMMDAGLIVMTAFISPFRAERDMARERIGKEHFVEVFVDTPLAVCERRDPKGLYRKARSGQLPNMTGIASPYEPPPAPDCILDTTSDGLDTIVQRLLREIFP